MCRAAACSLLPVLLAGGGLAAILDEAFLDGTELAGESEFATLAEVPRVPTGSCLAPNSKDLRDMRRSKSATGPPMSADHPFRAQRG
jgi:hypothetical protein